MGDVITGFFWAALPLLLIFGFNSLQDRTLSRDPNICHIDKAGNVWCNGDN